MNWMLNLQYELMAKKLHWLRYINITNDYEIGSQMYPCLHTSVLNIITLMLIMIAIMLMLIVCLKLHYAYLLQHKP